MTRYPPDTPVATAMRDMEERIAKLEALLNVASCGHGCRPGNHCDCGRTSGAHAHTIRDAVGLVPCGEPGCCTIRCRFS